MRQDPAHEHLVPDFFADDDDGDYEDFDYDYENYLQFAHGMMNGYNRAAAPPDFDPFFDLPDGIVPFEVSLKPLNLINSILISLSVNLVGVLFFPHMLSPNSRRQLYADDDSDEAEETGQAHFPHSNAPSFNAPPANLFDEDDEYFGKYGKYATVYDSDGYEIEDYTNPFHPDYYPQF